MKTNSPGCNCCDGGCDCTNGPAQFGESVLTLSEVADSRGPLLNVAEAVYDCAGYDVGSMHYYTFPGHTTGSVDLDSPTFCQYDVDSRVEIPDPVFEDGYAWNTNAWGGTTTSGSGPPPGCKNKGALAGRGKTGGGTNQVQPIHVTATVIYQCSGDTMSRTCILDAGYWIHDSYGGDSTGDFVFDPAWDATSGPYVAVVGDVEYRYVISGPYTIGHLTWYWLHMQAVSQVSTDFRLQDAPAYFDPYNLLRGRLTVT